MAARAGLPGFTIAHEQEVEGSLVAELRVLEVQPIRCAPVQQQPGIQHGGLGGKAGARQVASLACSHHGVGAAGRRLQRQDGSARRAHAAACPPRRRLGSEAAAQLGAPQAAAHECLIELLTGRTHQIRAQLSAVGCPLLGDSIYAPLASPQLRQASSPRPLAAVAPAACHGGPPDHAWSSGVLQCNPGDCGAWERSGHAQSFLL